MNWEDTDEDTVMHMMGYSQDIWKLSTFKYAFVTDNLDIHTLLYLANNYIRLWGLNSDIEAIRDYLEEMKRLGVD